MHIRFYSRKAFTLIELLVVIAIIAILSVVVILTLNPAELLRQSRDANRLSDLSTLNEAINLYTTDQNTSASFSLGTTSTIYVSIPDSSATSTAGDQCQGLGLPALPAGNSYHCAASSTFRNINTTGWIPVNFTAISSGIPFGNLPVDPVNQSSSNLYYTYQTNGSLYTLSSFIESQKYAKSTTNGNDPVLSQQGSGDLIMPDIGRGLVGYWPLDEGSGNTANDISGNSNNGALGAGISYTAGKVGAYAATFTNGNNYITAGSSASLNFNGQPFSSAFWVAESTTTTRLPFFGSSSSSAFIFGVYSSGQIAFQINSGANTLTSSFSPTLGQWNFIVLTDSASSSAIYINGVLTASGPGILPTSSTLPFAIGGALQGGWASGFIGSLDDVRFYNRVLSPAEIQEMYNAEK